ncbi:MAG: L-2-hydroxyglutarate oxidase LhgO [Firmicutes bacterium]|nr:L-2-hydroxyglutarate oxidase LhgO [candidate division NPL-UPA2 bacterium]
MRDGPLNVEEIDLTNEAKADVVIIGGGVVGAAIARELSRYNLSIVLLEKHPDLAMGTSKANSGILHAGFDAAPGTKKALFNVRGNVLYRQLEAELGIRLKWIGSLVVALEHDNLRVLEELLCRGKENGVPKLEMLSRDGLLDREPNLARGVVGALWCPTAGIVSPFDATLALAENAVQNGVKVLLEHEVEQVLVEQSRVTGVVTGRGIIETPYVINAAGVHAGSVAALAGDDSIAITPRKGEYLLFDTSLGDCVRSVLFPTPTKVSKGIVIGPTVHGNLFIGPNALDVADPDDVGTTAGGLSEIIEGAKKLIPSLGLGSVITQFAGLRAVAAHDDFIIGPSSVVRGLVHAGGIQSPGLTAAPAIAEAVVEILRDLGLSLTSNPRFVPIRQPRLSFKEQNTTARQQSFRLNPLYGRIVCRCETVTEAEIVEAIHAPCPAHTLDAVKVRTRAGMGRCQGGFCGPRVSALLARELDTPLSSVRKDKAQSFLYLPRRGGEHTPEVIPKFDVAVIGGGPAGMAAALAARERGAKRVVIIERDRELGGILNQCIHNGFGLHRFNEELTGPTYAQRYIDEVQADPAITVCLDTMVQEIKPNFSVLVSSASRGPLEIAARAVVLAMGCRERTRGAIRIPGDRPAGVFTAGAAQRIVNMEGFLPGSRVVVLGSGDIGLIMARRLTLEGAKVLAVVEIMPYSNGLTRNIVQCLEDYDIPLFLSHTVVEVHGRDRVTGVTVAKVDENRSPVPGSEFFLDCDCLLLSVGLIPENELSRAMGIKLDPETSGPLVDQFRHTSMPGVFAAGNVLHVHDLVDFVSAESEIAGRAAADFAAGSLLAEYPTLIVRAGEGVRSVVPQQIALIPGAAGQIRLYLRAAVPMQKCTLTVSGGQQKLLVRRFPVAKPSEMIAVDIDTFALESGAEALCVSLREGV